MASHSTVAKNQLLKQSGVSPKRLSNGRAVIPQFEDSATEGAAAFGGDGSALSKTAQQWAALRQQLATKTKELQSAISRADELEQTLLQFVSAVSHDLNAPLRAMTGFSSLLAQEHGNHLDDEAKQYLGRISGGASRMQAMISSISQYARASTQTLSRSRVDLNLIVDQVLEDLHEKIQQSQAVVTPKTLPVIHADPGQIFQLMRHLIDNSISFPSANRPQVTVAAERVADQWEITTQDNGRGIAAEQIQSAFEMFRRFDYDNQNEGGTGAGLTVCKQIVKRHGGEIFLHSELGVGTTVTVSFGEGNATTL